MSVGTCQLLVSKLSTKMVKISFYATFSLIQISEGHFTPLFDFNWTKLIVLYVAVYLL